MIYDFFTSFAGVCVIVAAGYLVGRVRVRGISLGLAGVLICAVFFGAAFSACGFDVSSVSIRRCFYRACSAVYDREAM